MKLSDLKIYQEIVIQCHDNPDPDTIVAGYALYRYFESLGCSVRLIYSGRLSITKPNINMLIEVLNIPIEYVESLCTDGLLITVDCQYGAGNVRHLQAKEVAIIDHHVQEVPIIEKQEIRSYLASASTLVWDMLCEEGFDVNAHLDISTALYYGLFTDSSALAEVNHPLDKDMRDSLVYDETLIRKLRNAILTLRELEIAGMALARHSYNADNRYVIVKAQECDPNILGLISDFALQVDCVDVCIVYNEAPDGVKYSVRSCVKEVMANELAVYLAGDVGNGGGHINRAAGFISKKCFEKSYSTLSYDEYFLNCLTAYYESFEVIDTQQGQLDESSLTRYQKNPMPIGFVKLSEVFKNGTSIIIRGVKEDIECVVQEDDYLTIDVKGSINLLDGETLKKNYCSLEKVFDIKLEYMPRVRVQQEDRVVYLRQYMREGVMKGSSNILARPLEKSVKVFTIYNPDQYLYGQAGDYIAMNETDHQKVFIIEKELFDKHYKAIE